MRKMLVKVFSQNDPIQLLNELIDEIRPATYLKPAAVEASEAKISRIVQALRADATLREAWKQLVIGLLSQYQPYYLYIEKSLLGQGSFFQELWKKVKVKVLPPVYESRNMVQLLGVLFDQKRDYKWVRAIPSDDWAALFSTLDLQELFQTNTKNEEVLIESMLHISTRITFLGADTDLLRKVHQKNKLNSPFYLQQEALVNYLNYLKKGEGASLYNDDLVKLFQYLKSCEHYVAEMQKNAKETGISLHLTYVSRRLLRQIERLRTLLRLWKPENKAAFYTDFIQLFQEVLEYQEEKNNIRRFVGESANLLAYEIVEHTAQKGEKYIAASRKEYFELLGRSMLGGFIIAFFASIKIFLDKVPASPLEQGMLFGLNYAACFVLVKLLGGMIATKQPAMTASNIAQTLDQFDDEQHIQKVKHLIIRLSKSQFISFVGNLVLAFPMAIAIALCYSLIFNVDLVVAKKALKLQKELQPLQAYFFAGIAGICLCLSGLIAGYFDNKILFSQVPSRVEQHPFLNKFFSKKRMKRLGKYLQKNTGALIGNISLGFMLGLAGYLGYLLTLPIDIRHIAFSAANFGFIFQYYDFQLSSTTFLYLLAAVIGIGFVNFLISFGMTFYIAFRSRNVNFVQSRKLLFALCVHFIKKPWDFFLPSFPQKNIQ